MTAHGKDLLCTSSGCEGKCGRCCKELGGALQASEGDMQRWKREKRADILRYVGVLPAPIRGELYDLWISPRTGEELERCPFFRKGKCAIHGTKPDVCREYPHGRKCLREMEMAKEG